MPYVRVRVGEVDDGPVTLRRRVRRWTRHGRRRVRRFRRSLRWSRMPRPARWGVLGVFGVLALGAVWIAVTALLAKQKLADLEARITTVRGLIAQGNLTQARQEAAAIPGMAEKAHEYTSGPAWYVAASIPYLGDPLDVARGTTSAVADLGAHAFPDLLKVADDINPAGLRVGGSGVRLTPLMNAAPTLQAASTSLQGVVRKINAVPTDTWVGAVNNGRDQLAAEVTELNQYVAAAYRAARVLPEMLGADGRTRRYFVGLQNEAEFRGTGGLPGAFAIVSARDGIVKFDRFESDTILLPPATHQQIATGLDFGDSYNALYGAAQPTTQYVDSNSSPNFPYAARIWVAMWEHQFHQHLDGALAIDPTALSYFLGVTGPTSVPDHVISAANVVPLVESQVYALFPDDTQRKNFLVSVFKAAATKLTSGLGSPFGFVQAASRAASERRLLVWTSDPASEALLRQTTYAGDISGSGPLSAVILNNAAAGKLDYYLQRSIDYSRTGCGDHRDVSVTIALDNDAPASGLPPYVTDRLDPDKPADAKPGDNRDVLDYYATGGSVVDSATLNGRPVTVSTTNTLGRTVVRIDVELPRGTTQTVEMHLSEPAVKGTPLVWIQPGVTPAASNVFVQSCG